jgi:hypothetical protein
MDDQHQHITDFDRAEAAIKDAEEEVADLVRGLQEQALRLPVIEGGEALRQLALARAAFEVGFMHAMRSLARPESPWMRPSPDRET